jgi:hypothetical protein
MEQRHVNDFRVQPSPAQVDMLVLEGVREALLERVRRGIPEPVVAGAGALVPAMVPPVAPLPIAGAHVGGGLVGDLGGVPLGGAAGHVGEFGLLPGLGVGAGVLPGGVGRLVPPPVGRGGVPVAGVGALAAAIGIGGGVVPGALPLVGGLLGGGVGGVADAAADATLDGEDPRTLAVAYDGNGQRHRDFREAATQMPTTVLAEFPVAGPRTPEWVSRLLLENGRHVYLGAQHDHIRGCPALQAHIAEELRKEAAVSKERREAREERQLAQPKKDGNG